MTENMNYTYIESHTDREESFVFTLCFYVEGEGEIVLVFGPIYLVGNQVLINRHSLMIRKLVYDLKSYC